MPKSNFNIKLKNHYKLYIPVKDKILFESKLKKKGIKYYINFDEQPIIDGGIRYFILDSDKQNVDQIIIENKIVANIESQQIRDYRDERKIMKVYGTITLIIIGIMILIILIDNLYNL